MSTLVSKCAAAIFCMALAASANAAIYTPNAALAAGQPTVPNPAGEFSFGHYTAAAGAVDPTSYANFSTFDESIANTGMDAFYTGSCCDPNIIYNDTNAPVTVSGFTMQPGDVSFGPFGGPTVIRFTAPAAGDYQVTSNFLGIQTGNNLAKAFVFQGTTQLDSGDATTDTGFSYSAVRTLAANETIDFVVAGTNSDFGNKTTKLTASLTSVPEPGIVSVALLGGMHLMLRRGRRD